MPTLYEQHAAECHRTTLCAIALVALVHFLVSLAVWAGFCGLHADILATMTWDELAKPVVYPILECTVVTVGFAVALILCRRGVPGCELLLTFFVALACVAFLKDMQRDLAQIHYFFKNPTFWDNHFYATWWLYSAGPYLTLPIRYSIAMTLFVGLTCVIWNSWYRNGRHSRLT